MHSGDFPLPNRLFLSGYVRDDQVLSVMGLCPLPLAEKFPKYSTIQY